MMYLHVLPIPISLLKKYCALLNINMYKGFKCTLPWPFVLQHPSHGIHYIILSLPHGNCCLNALKIPLLGPVAHDKFRANKWMFASVKTCKGRNHVIAIFEPFLEVVVLLYLLNFHQTHPHDCFKSTIVSKYAICKCTLKFVFNFDNVGTSFVNRIPMIANNMACSLIYNGLCINLVWRSYSSKMNPCGSNIFQV